MILLIKRKKRTKKRASECTDALLVCIVTIYFTNFREVVLPSLSMAVAT